MKSFVFKQKVAGSSKDWEVAKWDDGTYSCNCPAWIFHRGTKVDCKHIKSLIEEVTINVTSIKNEAQKGDMIKEKERCNDLLFKI